jgi:nitroreductase
MVHAAPEKCDPDAFISVFTDRRTVRRYKSDPVPEEHLRQILYAAGRGPTCMDQQPWKFLVVRDKEKIARMKKMTLDQVLGRFGDGESERKSVTKRFFEGYFTAPVYVVVLVDTESPCAGYARVHDGPIAAGYLMLAARAYGYGTAYLTDGIPENVVREVLNIPSRYHRICTTPIGVPDSWPKAPHKRKLEEMVAYETLEGSAPLEPIKYAPY